MPRGLVSIMEGAGKRLRPGAKVREPIIRGQRDSSLMKPERPNMNDFQGGGTRPAGQFTPDDFLSLAQDDAERQVLLKLYDRLPDSALNDLGKLGHDRNTVLGESLFEAVDDPDLYGMSDEDINTLIGIMRRMGE